MRTIRHRPDPDTVVIDYTEGDRIRLKQLGWWMAGLTFLFASGMVMSLFRLG